MMADVNGDKKADVVGFYEDGVWVSLSTGTGFSKPSLWVDNYGYEKGGWQPDRYLRMTADVNGDKKADVVGFGYPGVWISVSTGTDFSEPLVWVDYYAFAAGDWRIEKHPRMMADVDGDKKADVVGFYNDGVW
ncbi:MAG: peptidase M12A astacin, partial [bacterium]|nr:peptidase M12A astacin [bacterium]